MIAGAIIANPGILWRMLGNQRGRSIRLTALRSLLLLTPLSLAMSACGDEPDRLAVSVTLWHCGVEPVTIDGRAWEVPAGESVDGYPDIPLDSTNTPSGWAGRGTASVAEREMTYTDHGGEVVRFVPDDGQPPVPCN